MLIEISQFTEVVTEVSEKCARCRGTGNLPEFRRIKGGVCFACDGNKVSDRTREVKTERLSATYGVHAEVMGDDDTFESMLEQYQARKAQDQSLDAQLEAGEIDFFTWFDARAESRAIATH